MTITMLYAGLLSLWFVVLSAKVIQGRSGPGGIGLGDGGDAKMLRVIRGHANFAEYVPLILLMIGMLEYSGASRWLVHVLGATLLVARLLHGYALSFTDKNVFGRFWGAALTLLLLVVCGALCLYRALMV
jgi:uncharacterized protein